MKIGVYAEGIWQAKKFNRKLGIGEDALPYVGKNMISVADGAGGRGAERAAEINNELLNPERSFDVFLEECEMSGREAYRAQYNDNFSQLFELGEDYYAIGGRKSCYFGSRLATLFLRKIIEEDEFPEENIKEIFNRIDRMQMQDRDDYLVSLERRMAQKLQKLMHRAGKNGKLAPSQALKGSNYSFMSTTYSGICFYEEDNYVHVLSIQAGDSLAWGMIVEKDESTEQPRLALRQLQPGQENEAGGLLNSINVNDGFYLRCAYHKLENPCGILVSSDGCFDAFETQIHFERFLMWQLMKANNTAEAEKSIQEFFCINRPNDDSSSLALCLFGFKDYGMVSEMANRRQNQLYREFEMENSALYSQDESPEFLEEDARFALRGCIAGFSGRLWEDSAALRDEVMSVVREKYPERLQAIKQKYEYALARLDISRQIEDQIVEILQRYWLDIRKAYIPVANENRPLFFRKNIYEMLDSRDQLKKKIIGIQTQVRIETARIKTLSDRSNCSEDIAFEDLKTTMEVFVEDYEHILDRLNKLLGELKKAQRSLKNLLEDISHEISSILSKEMDYIHTHALNILRNPKQIKGIPGLSENDHACLQKILDRYVQMKEECRRMQEQMQIAENSFAREIFNNQAKQIIPGFLENSREDISAELLAEIEAKIKPLQEAQKKASMLIDKKKNYLNRYFKLSCNMMTQRR